MRIIGNAGNSARKVTAVASGALATGDTVIVNADGTVSVVGETSVSTAFGSATVFEAAQAAHISATYHPTEKKVVVFYEDRGNFDKGTYIVGTVSGTSIAFGSAALFEDASTSNISSVYDPVSGNIVVTYTDEGNSSYGTAIVGSLSGTTMSFGTAVVFSSSSTLDKSVTYDTSNSRVVVGYRDNGSSGHGTAVVGTVSGTSISFGSATVFSNTGAATVISAAYDINASKVVFAYSDSNSPYTGLGTSIVGTVSGTSISFGSEVVFDSSGAANHVSAAYDASNGKVVICYSDTGDAGKGKAIVGTVSGASISYGTVVVYETSETGPQKIVYAPNVGRVVIFFRDHANSLERSAIVGTVSGTTITFDTKENFGTSRSDYFAPAYDAESGKVVLAYEDQGNSRYGTALVMTVGGDVPNLTAENYIGIASNGYADTQTATINAKGFVDDNQSGLTAGQSYYVQTDGTLSTTAGDPEVFAGTAVSANKLIVKG